MTTASVRGNSVLCRPVLNDAGVRDIHKYLGHLTLKGMTRVPCCPRQVAEKSSNGANLTKLNAMRCHTTDRTAEMALNGGV